MAISNVQLITFVGLFATCLSLQAPPEPFTCQQEAVEYVMQKCVADANYMTGSTDAADDVTKLEHTEIIICDCGPDLIIGSEDDDCSARDIDNRKLIMQYFKFITSRCHDILWDKDTKVVTFTNTAIINTVVSDPIEIPVAIKLEFDQFGDKFLITTQTYCANLPIIQSLKQFKTSLSVCVESGLSMVGVNSDWNVLILSVIVAFFSIIMTSLICYCCNGKKPKKIDYNDDFYSAEEAPLK